MTIEERNQLVLDNQNLIHYVLTKYCRITPLSPNYEDLFQTGVEGLIKAIDRFDPDRGFKLSTYAGSMIYGEIRRYRRDCCSPQGIVIPRQLKDQIFRAIAQDADISNWSMYEQNAYLILTNQTSSLDYNISTDSGAGDDSSPELYEIVADNTNYRLQEELELEDALDKFLESCEGDPHYDLISEVMYDRLFSGGDTSDTRQLKIAKKYKLSQSQVSRIVKSAGERFKKFIDT